MRTNSCQKILPSRRKVRRPRETMGSIVGIDETTQKSVADKIISDDLHEATSDPPVRPQSTAVIDIDDTEPISVLRVYAGNTDLKATFKTVNFDRFMTARELLRVALQRFRVALSMESNYYLGVLHMDSQKKRLKDDDIVYEVLESLRSKHLPGVSGFTKISRVVNEHGLVSRVLMNDDNIIRVIINKEDASTSNQVFLARIFVRHEGRAHTEEHVYKTLALAKTTTVGEAVSLALKKFRLLPSEDFVSCLYQKTREEEVLLPNNETLASVVNDQKDASENLFVLAVKWAGEGPEPQDLYSLPQYSSAQRKSLAADINDILNLRPDFLNDSTSQQSPTIESDAKHAPNNGSDHNSDPLNQKCHGSSDHGQLVNSIDGLFNTIRASSDVKKSLDNGQISPEAENNCTWSHRSSGNSDNQVDTPPRDELVPATRASSTILDTHSRYSSPLYSSAQPPAQNSSPHSTPLQKSTPTPDPPSKPHNPARPLDTTGESASPDTDSNCHDPSSQGDPPDKIHGSPPLLPKKKCFKHSSTPLPATTKDLKPPVRKDSNVVNLTMAFDTVSVVKEGSPISQQDSTGSGVKMKKRSKSFDAMERYLEEIMSSGCQSNALNELEIKLKMATIENGSDS